MTYRRKAKGSAPIIPRMKLGMQLRSYAPGKHGNEFDTTLAVARACEQAGLDSIWMPDHFMFTDPAHVQDQRPVMEAFVILSALAATTTKIRLGELVTGMPYRNPALLAKMCTTLDIVSHGRTIVGLGAAWHEPEFVGYGWPFPPVRERMEMLEEGVQIMDLMLRQTNTDFNGKHYNLKNAGNAPLPVQKPRPPIMIGGGGEKATLKLVAKYADYCNVFGDPAQVTHKYAVLREHCEAVGRPYGEITLTNFVEILVGRDEAEVAAKRERFPNFKGVIGTPQQVIDQLGEYAKVGSKHILFHMPDAEDLAPLELLGEAVIPKIAEL